MISKHYETVVVKYLAIIVTFIFTVTCSVIDEGPQINLTITPVNDSPESPRTATITWEVTNIVEGFTSIMLLSDRGKDIGEVDPSGSVQVTRPMDTTFTLHVSVSLPGFPDIEAEKSVYLAVDEPELSLDEFFIQLLDDTNIPGLAAVLMVGEEEIWSGAFGFRRLPSQNHPELPVTLDTPFALASVTKTITGVAYLHAWEKALGTPNEFSLDININDMNLPFSIDNPLQENETITLRQIGAHRSSLIDSPITFWCAILLNGEFFQINMMGVEFVFCPPEAPKDFLGQVESYFTPTTDPNNPHVLYNAENNFSPSPPGTSLKYSNTAVGLAGLAFEYQVGTPLNQYVTDHIIMPLNLDSMRWQSEDYPNGVLAVGYTDFPLGDNCVPINSNIPCVEGYYEYTNHIDIVGYPSGGLKANVIDVAKYLKMILNGGTLDGTQILLPSTVQELHLSALSTHMFWRTYDTDKVIMRGHRGSVVGASTGMFYDPATGISMVFLMNADIPIWKDIIYKDIANRLHREGLIYLSSLQIP